MNNFLLKMKEEFVEINQSKKQLEGYIRMFHFMEGKYHILYLPGFNISGYGDTYQEAKELIDISIREFVVDLFSLSQHLIEPELIKLGWKKTSDRKLTQDQENSIYDIRQQFEIPDNIKIDESIITM